MSGSSRYRVESLTQFAELREDIEDRLKIHCEDQTYGVFLALNEAVNNALFHGKGINNGTVTITIRIFGGRRLSVRVNDPGKGFVPNSAINGVSDLWTEGGRGRFLMAAMMDKIVYNHMGNAVLLVKNLGR